MPISLQHGVSKALKQPVSLQQGGRKRSRTSGTENTLAPEPVKRSGILFMELEITLENIQQQARFFWEQVQGGVFAFHGEMGAGKTTFIAALCTIKGITDSVSSPTFSLINEYTYNEGGITKRIFHIDLYRLKDEEEAIQAGIEDCLYSGDICFVEWPEKIPSLLPENRTDIYLYAVDQDTRLLKIDFRR